MTRFVSILLIAHWISLPATSRAQPPGRPADNATAARIADGVEKAQAGKLLDAIEQFQRVLDITGDELVPVDPSQYTPARWVVHGLIARLPAEGIKLYRARVEGQAARRLDEAKTARDDAGLNRLLADMFAARAVEEAIMELARRAFERAEFDDAERFWRMLLPAPAADDPQLRFPDPKTPPAAIRARLILVKLFRGDRDDAKADFQALRTDFPNAAGLLAGRTGKYVDTLAELLNDPTQTTLPPPPGEPGWPTFAGSPARLGTNRAKLPYFWPDGPTWVKPIPFRSMDPKERSTADPRHTRALAFYPVIAGGRVYLADGARVCSFNLWTGEPVSTVHPEGGEEANVPVRQDVRYTLTEADGILYARLGPAALQAGDRRSFLIAMGSPKPGEPARPVLWRLDPPTAENAVTHFEGAPVVRAGRLFVGIWRHAGAEAQAGVACYRIDDPAVAPELAWQRMVGKAGIESNGETRHRHALVTLAGANVVYGTDGGTVIALDAATGRPAWEYRYPRNERPTLPRSRDLCPPLADGGRIYAAPADTDRLLCLDAVTGRLVWEREGVEVIHLLGVARGRLIATFGGQVRGIRGLNLRTGADSGTGGWTIHDDGGVGTFSRGLVTEEVVVWPTRHGLRFLDPADGTQLRSPIPGPPPRFPKTDNVLLPTEQPVPLGNLCYADGVLVVTTATHVFGFVSEGRKLGERSPAKVGGLRLYRDGASFILNDRAIVSLTPGLTDVRVYSVPGDRTAGLYPVHAPGRPVLAQTTSGRLLVWDRPSRPARDFPWTSKPWPQPPGDVGDGRFLIPDDEALVLFDAAAGKDLARYTLPNPDGLTGELPRFHIHQGGVLLLIDRNHGVEVDRLRLDGLKRGWKRAPVLVGRSLDDLVFADDRFVTAADSTLAAHDWKTGNQLWEAPLPDGTWKLAVAPQGIIAYPVEAGVRRPDFDAVGEFRRAGWDSAALLRAAGRTYDVWADRELPVLVFDPADGRLVQRLTFPAAGPAAGVAVTPKGVVVVTGKGSWTLHSK